MFTDKERRGDTFEWGDIPLMTLASPTRTRTRTYTRALVNAEKHQTLTASSCQGKPGSELGCSAFSTFLFPFVCLENCIQTRISAEELVLGPRFPLPP